MQAEARPRFRQDLVAEPLDDGGARFIDVMDPDSGSVFRFFEVEYSIACAMDGERDVAGIVKWAQEELGVTPSPAEVRSVIATLGDLGFLGADGAAQQAAAMAAAAAAAQPTPMARIPLKRTPASGIEAVAPAAAARDPRREDGLGSGVIVPPKLDAPTGATGRSDAALELGRAGGTASKAAPADLPAVEDLGLGVAGTTAPVVEKHAPVEDIPLGASGPGAAVPTPTNVSADLSEEFAVNPEDVKEAVRASKVMSAVDVPPELLAAIEGNAADKAASEKAAADKAAAEKAAAEKAAADKATAEKAAKAAADKAAADKAAKDKAAADKAAKDKAADKRPSKPAIELPSKVPESARAPTAPASRTSPVLVVLFILIAGGGLAYTVWRYVLNKPDETALAPKPKPEPPKPPPAPPKITVTAEPQPAQTVTATIKGQVDTVAADPSVKAGDPIVQLAGHAAPEQAVKDAKAALDKRTAEVAAAKAANDNAKLATATLLQKQAQGKLDAATADLAKYVVRAPIAGKLEVDAAVKKGSMLADNQMVAKVTPADLMVATFATPTDVTPDTKKVKMKAVAKGAELVCDVRVVEKTTTVACPSDQLASGDEIAFVGIAAETDEIDMGSGSAETGSAGSAGSAATGSAAAGSAAAAHPLPPPPAPRPPAPRPPTPRPPAPPATGSAAATPPPAAPAAGSDAPTATP